MKFIKSVLIYIARMIAIIFGIGAAISLLDTGINKLDAAIKYASLDMAAAIGTVLGTIIGAAIVGYVSLVCLRFGFFGDFNFNPIKKNKE